VIIYVYIFIFLYKQFFIGIRYIILFHLDSCPRMIKNFLIYPHINIVIFRFKKFKYSKADARVTRWFGHADSRNQPLAFRQQAEDQPERLNLTDLVFKQASNSRLASHRIKLIFVDANLCYLHIYGANAGMVFKQVAT